MSDDLRHRGSTRLAETHQLLTRLTRVEFGVHHVDRALRLEHAEEVNGLLQRVAQLAGSPPSPFGRERGVALRPREGRTEGDLQLEFPPPTVDGVGQLVQQVRTLREVGDRFHQGIPAPLGQKRLWSPSSWRRR